MIRWRHCPGCRPGRRGRRGQRPRRQPLGDQRGAELPADHLAGVHGRGRVHQVRPQPGAGARDPADRGVGAAQPGGAAAALRPPRQQTPAASPPPAPKRRPPPRGPECHAPSALPELWHAHRGGGPLLRRVRRQAGAPGGGAPGAPGRTGASPGDHAGRPPAATLPGHDPHRSPGRTGAPPRPAAMPAPQPQPGTAPGRSGRRRWSSWWGAPSTGASWSSTRSARGASGRCSAADS